jgi:hypothetical protein
MVKESSKKITTERSHFLLQKGKGLEWKTIKKSYLLEDIRIDFVTKVNKITGEETRILYCSFDTALGKWLSQLVLLVNPDHINPSFVEDHFNPPSPIRSQKNRKTNGTDIKTSFKINSSYGNIIKKNKALFFLTITFVFFVSACVTVGSILYLKFPLVFEQMIDLILE